MKLLKNKKGFTLVELLVAISIMGIIMVIALPQISNIQQNNKKTKYKKYAESMLSSGKLFTDSYTEDMFGNDTSGCYDISYAELKEKDLLQDIKINGDTCNANETFIRVRKANDHYFYDTSIVCKDKNGKIVYDEQLATGAGTCGGIDEDSPNITITPNSKDWTKGTNEKVKIKIWDDYGMLENIKIKISWTKDDLAYGSVTEHDFKNKRYAGQSEEKALEYELLVPQEETGVFKLTVTPVDVRDSVGNWQVTPTVSGEYKLDNTPPSSPTVSLYQWTNNSTEPTSTTGLSSYTENTWSAKKVYTVPSGSTDSHSKGVYYQYKTTGAQGTANNTKASAKSITEEDTSTIQWRACDKVGNCTSYTTAKTIKVDMTAPTLPTKGNIGTVSGKSTAAKIQTPADGSTDALSGFDEYRYLVTNTATKPTDKSKFTNSLDFTRQCGLSYYAWVIAVDNVGNTTAVKEIGNTADGDDDYDKNWSKCTKECNTGYQYKYNTCALKDTQSQKCNERTCCSETVSNVCGDWQWSSCTKTCDGGTKYQYRTCTLKSAFDGSTCTGSTTETQSANTACGTDPCETSVNATQYSGCDSYYITTCTTASCKYSKKNGAADSGTIEKAKLANQIDSNCNISYCSAWISGSNGGTTVYYTVSNMAKCALTNVYAGDSCSKSNVKTYSFNASFSGVTVQKDAGGCGFSVSFTGPLAKKDGGTSTSWRTYRCDTNWFCTSWCGESNSACAGSPS